MLKENVITNCLSIEGNSALHIKNDIPFAAINFGKNKNAYDVIYKNDEINEIAFDRVDL